MDFKSLLHNNKSADELESADEVQQDINKFAKSKGYDSVITNNIKDTQDYSFATELNKLKTLSEIVITFLFATLISNKLLQPLKA